MIALIDFGAGNLHSVAKALRHVGAEVKLVSRPEELKKAPLAVLPGVGAFDDCLNALQQRELLGACREFATTGRPFLGICVGYQALFDGSEEFDSSAPGLGIFRGKVIRFTETPGLKVPQIGWNRVTLTREGCPIFQGIPSESYFYFVHSYFPKPQDRSIVVGETEYGDRFASAIWSGNLFATQFHPEKSQSAGLKLLKNFVELASGS